MIAFLANENLVMKWKVYFCQSFHCDWQKMVMRHRKTEYKQNVQIDVIFSLLMSHKWKIDLIWSGSVQMGSSEITVKLNFFTLSYNNCQVH